MSAPSSSEESISLLQVTREVWAGRKIVAIVIAISLLLGIVYLHVAQPLYTVSLDIAPVPQNQEGQSAGNLGGLKSLIGNTLGGGDETQYSLLLSALHSNKIVAEALLKRPDLLHVIFAREWNSPRQQWAEPFSPLRIVASGVKSVLGIAVVPWAPPDLSRISLYLDKIKIASNPEDPVTQVSIQVPDPKFGRDLLFSTIKILDDYMKLETRERANAYIANIQRQLKTTNTLEVRESLIELLTQQEKTSIAASSSLPYVAHVFGPITSSDAPTSPNALIVIGLALFMGLLLGSALVLIQDSAMGHAALTTAGPIAKLVRKPQKPRTANS